MVALMRMWITMLAGIVVGTTRAGGMLLAAGFFFVVIAAFWIGMAFIGGHVLLALFNFVKYWAAGGPP